MPIASKERIIFSEIPRIGSGVELETLLLSSEEFRVIHPIERTDLENLFFREKQKRDDNSSYIGNLLVRQRQINHKVVSFSSEIIPTGSLVIDACAGPEGSVLASKLYGYDWVGNDISNKFADDLHKTGIDKIVVSDFSRSPFKSEIAQGVYFIFALNNINRPANAIAEAARITKNHGVITIADPGPSLWVSDILLYSLLDNSHRNCFTGNRYNELENYFKNKEYSIESYTDYFLEYVLGAGKGEMNDYVQDFIKKINGTKKSRRSLSFYFQQKVTEKYLEFQQKTADSCGFEPVKIGIMSTAFIGDKEGWQVTEIVPLDKENWLEEIISARMSKSDLIPKSVIKANVRNIFPVVCYQKRN
jgi:ubiquinone/menaquinone biosynthesis C-methylase UbiE